MANSNLPTVANIQARQPEANVAFPVVAIGASAGGLEACSKLLDAMPANPGMAFVVVQHLDPNHGSLLADLLQAHTSMPVAEATQGILLVRDHVYVIPPGRYLTVEAGALHLEPPATGQATRLPFDRLLHSMAAACGAWAACLVLSGNGADGSLGLKAIKAASGLVLAQQPEEAEHDGMPGSAVMSGAVDQVLPLAEMPQALMAHSWQPQTPREPAVDWLARIVDLLRSRTAHDFSQYKRGTLTRRVQRRLGLAGLLPDDTQGYLDLLSRDAQELGRLAKDLLIHVTSFFRDPAVFDYMATKIIPGLLARSQTEQPLRIWVAGCSTGEEAYSLAMLFREQMSLSQHPGKLQIFASDIDPDAVATARDGLYPQGIEAEVSPARIARFFQHDAYGWRVRPELRSAVVFTVQDVLTDPPFSRLDLISCRNMLIYLRPEAQETVLANFHFALGRGGLLLLGSAESAGNAEGRFELVGKAERLYRQIGRRRAADVGLPYPMVDGPRGVLRAGAGRGAARHGALAELCRRLVAEAYSPAAVLINQQHDCLYSLGPIECYLRVAPGHPTHDLLAMAHERLRGRLRAAIQQVAETRMLVVVTSGDGDFNIELRPATTEGEDLVLVCFVDIPRALVRTAQDVPPLDLPRVTALERELTTARAELSGAVHELQVAREDQKAINEEARSVNEEFQSTNEELLTSKEELQSLNEELTALNGQLQETLERQRTTSSDLQNVLYSTEVATLFLDNEMRIRFFTPATRALFNVIPTDVGRPLADLTPLAVDSALQEDAVAVRQSLQPIEREIEASGGTWFNRRMLPYRTHDNTVSGVVVTFTDITERKHHREALQAAQEQAELANRAKSRFLAAASHDLRQPLQTLLLLQSLLTDMVEGEAALKVVAMLDPTLNAMTGMLNALLDINQIDAGTLRCKPVPFRIGDLLARLHDEFAYHAKAQGLEFRLMSCGATVLSDPRLLEQMLRNLLSNALKYTTKGKVLVGCRRRGATLVVEVWDTGIGIPRDQLDAIFNEYHQLDNAAREPGRGLGLGLSIVQRLGKLLGHAVQVRSDQHHGSCFTVVLPLAEAGPGQGASLALPRSVRAKDEGVILLVEDNAELLALLAQLLRAAGHEVATALDGVAALKLVADGVVRPDLLLSDFNLPNGLNGLQLTMRLRSALHLDLPVIILTGDISTETLRDIARQGCVHLHKPVTAQAMTQAVRTLLLAAAAPPQALLAAPAPGVASARIYLVDDDTLMRTAMREVLQQAGWTVLDFAACEAFLAAYQPGGEACLLLDAYLPGMSGMQLLQRMAVAGPHLPTIMMTGNSDVPMAVEAMRAGAADFIEKPMHREELLASISHALELSRDSGKRQEWQETAAKQVAQLTLRQRQVMEMVLAGAPSKNIAADLGISQRTVENHRAAIMHKTGSKSLPALARLALAAMVERR